MTREELDTTVAAGEPSATSGERSGTRALPRRHFLAGTVGIAGAIVAGKYFEPTRLAAANVRHGLLPHDGGTVASSMYVVAHPDDSLIFQSPSLLQNIQGGNQVVTVHLTAGDDGLTETYWGDRESGIQAAYAQMAGVADAWTLSTLAVGSFNLATATLTASSNIVIVYFRLPDGGFPNGDGTAAYGFQSLSQLWLGTESAITSVDSTNTYSASDVTNTLASLMGSYQPVLIATQDFVNSFEDGDHQDHYATAFFTKAAHDLYGTMHTLVGYMGYPISIIPSNVAGTLLTTKQDCFYTYGSFDNMTCSDATSCAAGPYAAWLTRQYVVGSVPASDTPVSSAGPAQSVFPSSVATLNASASSDPDSATISYTWSQTSGSAVALSSTTSSTPTFTAPAVPATLGFSLFVSNGTDVSTAATTVVTVGGPPGTLYDVAQLATATASSQNVSTGQLARSAIDGVISGYPADTTAEWATVGGGAGSWLLLTWATPYQVDFVTLYDRPNLTDQITSGTLTFSDGTSVNFGALPNDASSGLSVSLVTPKLTTSLLMTVTGVSATTTSVGLAEIEAWGVAVIPQLSGTPVAVAGSQQTVPSGADVTLDGTGSSDPNNLSITYSWSQLVGPNVELSSTSGASPTFTAPTGPSTLIFELVVSNGTLVGVPSVVNVLVNAPVTVANVAPLSTATASSQNTASGQLASSAIDGIISGYPADATAEWATVGGGVGSWLLLTWSSSYVVNYVTLYDRPNLNDQVTSGTLTFSDGTVVPFGTLPNDASSGLVVTPSAPNATTSLLMTVTGVSATTTSVGLAELQAWGSPALNETGDIPITSAGPTQNVIYGATVALDGSGSSDPGGASLTYSWNQIGGPTVSLSSSTATKPTFVAPTSVATLMFALTVANSVNVGTPQTVTVNVSAPVVSNVAPLSTVTASSQNYSTGQMASSAVDGVISGFPANPTAEWCTVDGGVGSWLLLTWLDQYVIDYVTLFDRPSLTDQITAGTLTFSDGTVVPFGTLPNDATTGLTVTPTSPLTTTSVLMTVTAVSATTENVGLAEVQAWGYQSE